MGVTHQVKAEPSQVDPRASRPLLIAMTHSTPTPRSSLATGLTGRLTWAYALIVLTIVRLLVSAALWRVGVLAVSDDDFARITIAERFAATPRLDPTQTSWLPFPFWWMGGLMRPLGSSMETARVCSEIGAVMAAWLLFAGGRAVGMTVASALTGSLLATVLPIAAVLGCAPVPELPTAALGAFALLAAGHRRAGAWDLFAALAICAASLSRYEAWPVAVVVAGTLWARKGGRGDGDGARRWLARARTGLSVSVAMAGPIAWMVHQRVAHGDALHFLRRVAAYRAALSGSGAVRADLARYLVALVSAAPALTLSVVVLAWIGPARLRIPVRAPLSPTGAWSPAVSGAIALLLFLFAGAWIGGVPTHHAGRTLLLVWMLASMGAAEWTSRLAPRWAWGWRVSLALLSALHFPSEIEGGLDRRKEVAVGRLLRTAVAEHERVLVATDDYGYFAIIAAFGRPLDTVIDHTHDPREGGEAAARTNAERIRSRLRDEQVSWVVVPARVAVEGPALVARDDAFAVYRADSPTRPAPRDWP